MIVKILSSTASFNGVSYNTEKVDKGKGELLKVANFGGLQGLAALCPEDYRNYLKMISARNNRVKNPQFHAVISAKGKSATKQELNTLAEKWLAAMGYGEQPYLVVFHNDTKNNHVHLVSTRVDRQGRKISDQFEKIRAVKCLNQLVGLDEKQSAERDVQEALQYVFGTRAQFVLLLEQRGYTVKQERDYIQIIRYGIKLQQVPVARIDAQTKLASYDSARIQKLKALFYQYATRYDPALLLESEPLPGGRNGGSTIFSSDFSEHMKSAFGLELIFHAKEGQLPYGYTIVDHACKAIYKGGTIMALNSLLAYTASHSYPAKSSAGGEQPTPDRPSIDLAVDVTEQAESYIKPCRSLPEHEQQTQLRHTPQVILSASGIEESSVQTDHIPAIQIAGDIDDEAIYGRKRRRKSKINTNTR